MIRVVVQYTPRLFALGIAEEAAITPTFVHDGTTHYLAERHDRWVLYKPAVSGGGAAPTLHPQQR